MTPDEMQMELAERAVGELLGELDPDPEREGLEDTPRRVARMWLTELTQGYDQNVDEFFKDFDNNGYEGIVTIKDIPVISTCEHHMVPIVGYAHVGYFPSDRIVGLSKLARVVNAYARRLQVQERLTQQIFAAIQRNLSPRGTIVVIEAEHLCMTMRGVQAPGTKTITSSADGLFIDEQGTKDEFLTLIGRNHG